MYSTVDNTFTVSVGSYKFIQKPFDKDMNDLERKFKEEGYYDDRFV